MGGGGSQGQNTIANGDANSISNSYDSFIAGQGIRMDTKGRTGATSLRPSIGFGYNYILQDAGVLFFGDKQQPTAGTPYIQSWIDDAVIFRAQHGTYLLGGLNVGWTNLPDNGAIIATNYAIIGTTNRYATSNIFEVDWTNGQALTINQTNGSTFVASAVIGNFAQMTNLMAVGFSPDFSKSFEVASTNTGPVIFGLPINLPSANYAEHTIFIENSGASLQSVIATTGYLTNAAQTSMKVTNVSKVVIEFKPGKFTNFVVYPRS
jgi:hypothetical protein